ncbi:MAG TPA: DUF6458 family protein [Solirubrobacteraceae bacterium]|nr:DUF6458 family protein [Solirubrobacteraceae bacterium]
MPSVGTSILLIAAGAILRFAVTASVEGVSLRTVGLILLIVGIVALAISLFYMLSWAPARRARVTTAVREERDLPPEEGGPY